MEKRIIVVGGKELKVGFSMAVAIEWEKQTGEIFDIETSLGTVTGQMALCYAAVKHYNKDAGIGSIEDWLDGITFEESVKMQTAVAECLSDFYRLPEKEEEQGEGEKNA